MSTHIDDRTPASSSRLVQLRAPARRTLLALSALSLSALSACAGPEDFDTELDADFDALEADLAAELDDPTPPGQPTGETEPAPTHEGAGGFTPIGEDDAENMTICGSDDFEDVEDGSAQERTWADAVALLEYDGASGCTGALIAENILLTAGHCIDPDIINPDLNANFQTAQALCTSVVSARFNHQLVGGALPPLADQPAYDCQAVLDFRHDGDFDYAIIELAVASNEPAPGQLFGFLETDFRRPTVGTPLTLISHPEGEPKQISRDEVRSVNDERIQHKCDTKGGSSGGPLIDDHGRVIAVHTKWGCVGFLGTNKGHTLENSFTDSQWFPSVDYFDQKESGVLEDGDRFGAAVAVGDFDGDGSGDVAAAAPNDEVGGVSNAGWISVRLSGTRGPRPQTEVGFRQRSGTNHEANDYFGEVLATGDFDNDGYDDLAIGTPREDNGSSTDSGVVHIAYGSSSGLVTSTLQDIWPSELLGTNEAYGKFGTALAVGDFNDDGYDDLAIGAPGQGNDGAFYVVRGSSSGLDEGDRQRFVQSITGTNQSDGGQLGYALAAGDFDNDGYDDLAAGSPYEDVGGVSDAGYVTLVHGGPGIGLNPFSSEGRAQSGAGGTSSESGDHFGMVMAAGDFDNDSYDDVAFGIPDEDMGSTTNAGYITVFFGSNSSLAAGQGFSMSSLAGATAAYDYLGDALVACDLDGDGRDDLVAGVPGEDNPSLSGTAFAVFGTSGNLAAGSATEVDITAAGVRTFLDDYGSEGTFACGDVDRDDDDDLVVGIPQQSTHDTFGSGAVLIQDIE